MSNLPWKNIGTWSFYLPGILSECHFVNLSLQNYWWYVASSTKHFIELCLICLGRILVLGHFIYLAFCQNAILSTYHCKIIGGMLLHQHFIQFCLICLKNIGTWSFYLPGILSKCHFVNFSLQNYWWYVASSTLHSVLSNLPQKYWYLVLLSTRHFVKMPFHQLIIAKLLVVCCFINAPFHRVIFNLPQKNIGTWSFFLLGILSKCHYVNIHLSLEIIGGKW